MRRRPIEFRSRPARVSLWLLLAFMAGAASLFGARPFTLERSKVNGSVCWECSDGSAGGSARDRRAAKAAALAACPKEAPADDSDTTAPTRPRDVAVSVDAHYAGFSSAVAGDLVTVRDEALVRASFDPASGHAEGIDLALQIAPWRHFALDLGLFGGEGRATRSFHAETAMGRVWGVESIDLQRFGGEAAIRFYPLAGVPLRPWVAVGARGASLRPLRGRIDLVDARGGRSTLPAGDLRSVWQGVGIARFGFDLQLRRSFGATLSGALDQDGALTARFGMKIGLGGGVPVF